LPNNGIHADPKHGGDFAKFPVGAIFIALAKLVCKSAWAR